MSESEAKTGARSGLDHARSDPRGRRDTPPIGSDPILSVKRLSLSIGSVSILENVTLLLGSGEILGFVGESGSGKSMTALAVMGLLPVAAQTTGAVHLGGRSLLGLPDQAMRAVRGRDASMIFQEPMTALNPLRSIGDQVAETVWIHTRASRAEALERARAMLDRVGLGRFDLGTLPHQLSGGQRRRVMIAMAVALKPKLLIADEPTTALDMTTQAQILSLLQGLVAEDGMAMMLITHDLAVVSGVADHVAIMERGRVVEVGPTRAVFAAQDHAYTRNLFAASTHQPVRYPVLEDEVVLRVKRMKRSYRQPRRSFFGAPGEVEAVKGVSFELRRGETLGLVGESGSGKSTLARALLGLETVSGGDITLHGRSIALGMRPEDRRRIGVVFQDPYGSFNPRHRVERLICEPFHLLETPPTGAERTKRVALALEEVGLRAKDAHKYIHQFSGGQRQRIAIARALMVRPDVLVLDEAVSALDVSIRAQVLDLLADLTGRHRLSTLFISHDLSVVRAISDRVLVMKEGKIVEQGLAEHIFQAPRHAYTRALLAAAPKMTEERG